MTVEKNNETALVLKYGDKSSARFSNVVNKAATNDVYNTALVLNGLQTTAKKISEVKRVYKYDIVDESEAQE